MTPFPRSLHGDRQPDFNAGELFFGHVERNIQYLYADDVARAVGINKHAIFHFDRLRSFPFFQADIERVSRFIILDFHRWYAVITIIFFPFFLYTTSSVRSSNLFHAVCVLEKDVAPFPSLSVFSISTMRTFRSVILNCAWFVERMCIIEYALTIPH